MNKQEAFDKAWRGVVKQGRKSRDERSGNGECCYKLVDGNGAELRCAVGHLLTDEQLVQLGGQNPSARALAAIFASPIVEGVDRREEQYFLHELQKCHDNVGHLAGPQFIKEFKERMTDLAADCGLTVPADV